VIEQNTRDAAQGAPQRRCDAGFRAERLPFFAVRLGCPTLLCVVHTLRRTQVEVTSCALGGHLLGYGNSFAKAIKTELPDAEVRVARRSPTGRAARPTPRAQVVHKMGLPLQFSVDVDGTCMNKGVTTLLGGSSAKVAKEVAEVARSKVAQ